MIITHFEAIPAFTYHCARVAGVGTVDLGWSDENHRGSATSLTFLLKLRIHETAVFFHTLFDQHFEFRLALITLKEPVHTEECLLQCCLVVLDLAFVALLLHKLLFEMLPTKLGHFRTSMAVKHAKELIPVAQIRLCYVSIFHVSPPALHFRHSITNNLRLTHVIVFLFVGRVLETR